MKVSEEDFKEWTTYPQTKAYMALLKGEIIALEQSYTAIDRENPFREYGSFKEKQGKEIGLAKALEIIEGFKGEE